jgi:hypothetical protein
MIPFSMSMKSGDFKVIQQKYSPNLIYFFYFLGLPVTSLPCYLLGKKYSTWIELMIPFYCIYLFLVLIPAWYEHPSAAKIIAKMTLLHANNMTYIINLALVCFFTSHYTISFAARSLLTVNCLNMSFRRWLAKDSTLLPVLFNFFTTTMLIEGFSYTQNKQKVELFLEKENVKKQEEQMKTILHNIPTNVMLINESKLVLKNRHCENLINSVCKSLGLASP